MRHLAQATELRQLDLDGNGITDAGLEHLKGLTRLEVLSVNDTKVTDAGLEHVKDLTKLDSLYVGHTRVTEEGRTRLRARLSQCKIGDEATKESDQAVAECGRAIDRNPKDADAYLHRAVAWMERKEFDKMLADCEEIVRLLPDCGAAYAMRGVMWRQKKELDKALADFSRALKLQPDLGMPYVNRISIWCEKGDYEKAMNDCKEALRLAPNEAMAYNNVAWFQATCPDQRYRNGKEAVANATRACELSEGKNWCCVCTLAEAYAENGEFAKARESVAKALELAVKEEDRQVCRIRLELFKQNKPYRETPPGAIP